MRSDFYKLCANFCNGERKGISEFSAVILTQKTARMDALLKIVPKFSIYIVDNDYTNGLSVKGSLEKSLGDEVSIQVFPDAESCLAALQLTDQKPSVVIVEYTENKRLNEEKGLHMVDQIKKISSEAAIIVFSDKSNSARATKALAYGAHDFVIKDQFQHEHILSAVKKCLHPAKM